MTHGQSSMNRTQKPPFRVCSSQPHNPRIKSSAFKKPHSGFGRDVFANISKAPSIQKLSEDSESSSRSSSPDDDLNRRRATRITMSEESSSESGATSTDDEERLALASEPLADGKMSDHGNMDEDSLASGSNEALPSNNQPLGTIVKLQGLANNAELNGLEAELVEFAEDTGRFTCILTGSREIKKVRPINIAAACINKLEILPTPDGNAVSYAPVSS